MLTLNKLQITGRVANVQVKDVNGSRFASIRIASGEKYTRRDGIEVEDTLWLDVVVNGNSVDFVDKYVGKGDLLFVEGRLKERKWTDREGNERTAFEVRCQNVQIVAKKKTEDAAAAADDDDLPENF